MKLNNEETITLAGLKDSTFVLFYYPKDNTPGCTNENKSFNSNLAKFQEKNVKVFGVSGDSLASHCKFVEKLDLKFNLAVDEVRYFDLWKYLFRLETDPGQKAGMRYQRLQTPNFLDQRRQIGKNLATGQNSNPCWIGFGRVLNSRLLYILEITTSPCTRFYHCPIRLETVPFLQKIHLLPTENKRSTEPRKWILWASRWSRIRERRTISSQTSTMGIMWCLHRPIFEKASSEKFTAFWPYNCWWPLVCRVMTNHFILFYPHFLAICIASEPTKVFLQNNPAIVQLSSFSCFFVLLALMVKRQQFPVHSITFF